MGVINDIYNLMTQYPELNFSIEGHTDNDGSDDSNMKLSESRAITVLNQLVSMGIDSKRLKAKGFGESKPLSDNNTSEGKANNRRVCLLYTSDAADERSSVDLGGRRIIKKKKRVKKKNKKRDKKKERKR